MQKSWPALNLVRNRYAAVQRPPAADPNTAVHYRLKQAVRSLLKAPLPWLIVHLHACGLGDAPTGSLAGRDGAICR